MYQRAQMKLKFTKMHGAGNDFVVFDGVSQRIELSPEQVRRIADRHLGIGCDQVLLVEPPQSPGADFRYRIFNADGGEVEQCGNGARCFARFVRDRGLSDKAEISVDTLSGRIAPRLEPDGGVTVNMGAPVFDPERVPFIPESNSPAAFMVPESNSPAAFMVPESTSPADIMVPESTSPADIMIPEGTSPAAFMAPTTTSLDALVQPLEVGGTTVMLSVLSMGNPHAVQVVADVAAAPVTSQGPLIETHPRFPQRVNAGYLQVLDRHHARLRVWERGAGETLSCGTGACAAAVAGIGRGLLDSPVRVSTRGGDLTIRWDGGDNDGRDCGPDNKQSGSEARGAVWMTGPATTVFEGEIEIDEGR